MRTLVCRGLGQFSVSLSLIQFRSRRNGDAPRIAPLIGALLMLLLHPGAEQRCEAALAKADASGFEPGCAGSLDASFAAPHNVYAGGSGARNAVVTGTSIVAGAPLYYASNTRAVIVQPDGKILVSGTFGSWYGDSVKGVIRLNPDGSRDRTFSSAITANDYEPGVTAMILLPDGKILIGRSAEALSDIDCCALVRLNSNGSLDPTFDGAATPIAGVNALALAADGKYLVGHDGGLYAATNSGLLRLNVDGTRDTNFIADAKVQPQFSILPQPNGGWLIDGLTRLNAAGEIDPTFVPEMPTNFTALAALAQPDGKILVAGGVLATGWDVPFPPTHNIVVRLNSDGTRDITFRDNAMASFGDDTFPTGEQPSVRALGLQSNGQILVGGLFTHINGSWHPGICRLNADGTLDESFATDIPVCVGCDLSTLESVTAINVTAEEKLLIGGTFTQINGIDESFVARLFVGANDCAGVVTLSAPEFVVSEKNGMAEIVLIRRGDLTRSTSIGYEAVEFSSTYHHDLPARSNIDFVPVSGVATFQAGQATQTIAIAIRDNFQMQANKGFDFKLARVPGGAMLDNPREASVIIVDDESAGVPGSIKSDLRWAQEQSASICAAVLQPDGKIIAAANVPFWGWSHFSIVRLNSDGSLDKALTTDIKGYCFGLSIDPGDGGVLVAGSFSAINGVARINLVRLRADGTVDPSFNAGLESESDNVHTVRCLAGGDLLIGGSFTEIGGAHRTGVARLHSDGSVDDSFVPDEIVARHHTIFPARVMALAVDDQSRILMAGDFTYVGGAPCTNFVRLNADGSRDSTFNTASFLFGALRDIVLQPDGKIILAGSISIAGLRGNHAVVRLNPDGSRDTSFAPYQPATHIALQSDGRIIVDGVTRLNADGSVDASYFAGTAHAGYGIYAVLLEANGDVIVAGQFDHWNEIPAPAIVRLQGGESSGRGWIEFAATQVPVMEENTVISVSVRRVGGSNGAASVAYRTVDDSARAGHDYSSVSGTITYADGETGFKPIEIPILNDALATSNRTFFVELLDPTGAPVGPQGRAAIQIIDDETGVGFASDVFDSVERQYSVRIQLLRTGTNMARFTVDLEIVEGGTAIAGVDYIPFSAPVVFESNVTYATAYISIIDNNIVETNKTIKLVLKNPTNGILLSHETATIVIHDDDRPWRCQPAAFGQSGNFCITLDIPPQAYGRLQGSTDLINWRDVQSFYREINSGPVVVEDALSPELPQRFYRVIQY